MNDGGGELADWLKWITGGVIAGMLLFWQWMDRKIDAVNARIDKLRDDTRDDRHDLADKVRETTGGIDDDLNKLGDRVTRLERNGDHKQS